MFYRVRSKKGVSIMIGYVLLVTFAIIIGLVVYQWMKTYVPQEDLNCPDGVSLFIKDYSCDSNALTINFRNNGKFNVGGYFIYASNSSGDDIATIDFSGNITGENAIIQSVIKFGAVAPGNSLEPNEEESHIYDLTGMEDIRLIEILPVRWQEEKNRNILVTCKDAKVRERIECGGEDTTPNPREEIAFWGCEETDEIDNWVEDPDSPLISSGNDVLACEVFSGAKVLSGNGDLNDHLAWYNRSLGLSGYTDINISFYLNYVSTEDADDMHLYYGKGDSWTELHDQDNLGDSTSWTYYSYLIDNEYATTDFDLQFRWETSASEENIFLDNITITGIPE